jgi:hypothetical protein
MLNFLISFMFFFTLGMGLHLYVFLRLYKGLKQQRKERDEYFALRFRQPDVWKWNTKEEKK